MKSSEIRARRDRVSQHLKNGTPEDRIAELLGVHRNTVVRDVAHIKQESKGWLDDLAKDGFIHEYRMALEKIREHELELRKLLPLANTWQKIQLVRALDENVKLYLELLGETPAVHAYRRAVRRLQEKGRPDVQAN